MNWQRTAILICGPVIIIAGAYVAARRGNGSNNVASAATDEPVVEWRKLPLNASAGREMSLSLRCRQLGGELATKLGSNCSVLVRPPFVLAGNYSEEVYDQLHRETILPTMRALSVSYFDRHPDEPITVLIFSSEAMYQRAATLFDGRQRASYSGYYLRDQRRLLVDLSTGDGTLVHELTHALGHFDFAQMPEWFDEGFASLHEQASFSADGLSMQGRSNWRLHYLVAAARRNQLPSIERLTTYSLPRDESAAVGYAQARYVCLYLQQKGLLVPYYRKLRGNIADDPSGLRTLLELLELAEPTEFDQLFRQWILKLPKPGSPTPKVRESRVPLTPRFA